MRKATLKTLIATASALAFSTPVFAQSPASPAAPAPAADNGGIEDIIVTAQRRAENIQNVSIAIQAITAEGLVRSGITDVTRLDLVAPGVTFARYGADSKISIRGANSNNTFLDAAPTVGVFIDGVFRPQATQQTRSFFDVDRVEVLKGPQGTLYGRNTLAGAVNVWTKSPDASQFGIGGTVSYARFNTLRTEAYVNVPLIGDRLALRVAGLQENGDGYVQNQTGPNLGAPSTISVRGSLRYEGDDGGSVLLKLQNVRERGSQLGLFAFNGACRQVTTQGFTDPFGTVTDCQNPRRGAAGAPRFDQLGPLTVQRGIVPPTKIDEFSAVLDVNLPLGADFGARGIFSYTGFKVNLGQANNFAAAPYAADLYFSSVKSWTNEIQFSNKNGPFKILAGGYASRDEIKYLSATLRYYVDNTAVRVSVPVNGSPTVSLPVLIATPISGPINVGDPLAVNGAGLPTRNGQSSNNFQYLNVDNYGLFGQASYEITSGLRLVGGIRYSSENKSAINYGGANSTTSFVGPQFPTFINTDIEQFSTNPSLATSRTQRSYNNVTWRGAIEYDVAPNVMLFANVATGFLSGNLNTDGTTTDQQTSINYEAGIKSRFLNNRIQVNASVYHVEYSNLITSFQRPNNSGGVDTISANGGAIKSTGAEIIVEARPIDNLRLTASASVLDAKFGVFNVLVPYQLYNGNPNASAKFISLQGGTPPFSPKFQATFIASYDIQLGSAGKLTPNIQFYFSGRYSSQTQVSFIDPAGTQEAFTKTDLRLSWNDASDRFGIDAYVENIEDNIVKLRTTYGGDGIEQITYGYPRNYGVRLRAKF